MSYDRPLNASDYPIRAVGPSLYRRTASSPIAVLPSRDMAADVAARLNATLAPTAPEPTQWPARRPVTRVGELPVSLTLAEQLRRVPHDIVMPPE